MPGTQSDLVSHGGLYMKYRYLWRCLKQATGEGSHWLSHIKVLFFILVSAQVCAVSSEGASRYGIVSSVESHIIKAESAESLSIFFH